MLFVVLVVANLSNSKTFPTTFTIIYPTRYTSHYHYSHGVRKAGAGAQLLPRSFRKKLQWVCSPKVLTKQSTRKEKCDDIFTYTVYCTVDMDKPLVYCTSTLCTVHYSSIVLQYKNAISTMYVQKGIYLTY